MSFGCAALWPKNFGLEKLQRTSEFKYAIPVSNCHIYVALIEHWQEIWVHRLNAYSVWMRKQNCEWTEMKPGQVAWREADCCWRQFDWQCHQQPVVLCRLNDKLRTPWHLLTQQYLTQMHDLAVSWIWLPVGTQLHYVSTTLSQTA